jgi:hypothetical protein
MDHSRAPSLFFAFACSCATGFDAKSAAEGHRVDPVEQKAAAPAPTGLAREPFAIAAIAYDRDPFSTTPSVSLPFDAHLSVGTFTSLLSVGEADPLRISGHTCYVAFAGDWARFDREIGPKVVAAVPAPPGTAILFGREKTPEGREAYAAVLVRTPPILSAADAASAQVVQREHVEMNLNTDTMAMRNVPSVAVTFTKEGVEKLATWTAANPGRPTARIAGGRVVSKMNVLFQTPNAPWPPRVDSVVLELDGQTTADAEALARAIAK